MSARAFDRRTTGEQERTALAQLAQLAQQPADEDALEAALAQLVPPFPLKIQLQTHTRCNAACAMCPYPEIAGADGFSHAQMSEATYRQILAQLAPHPVERLSLFLMNEPLLDKRLPEWIALARAQLPATTLGLFTNGSPLTVPLAHRLADAGLDELCVSVHGFDPATYDAVMQGLGFARVRERLRPVLESYERGELGRLHLQLVTGDLPELHESLRRAEPLFARHALLKAFSNERAAAEVASGLPSSVTTTARRPLCQRPFVKLYVNVHGDCVLCNVDWRQTVVLGRIGAGEEGQIARIWQSPQYHALRLLHLRQRWTAGHICERCDYPALVEGE
jgi:hypothetical protein